MKPNRARMGKRDENQSDLVRVFETMGCEVVDMGSVGGGLPDLMFSVQGRTYLAEVKTEDGRLRTGQLHFARRWKAPVYLLRNTDDAITLINLIRGGIDPATGGCKTIL